MQGLCSPDEIQDVIGCLKASLNTVDVQGPCTVHAANALAAIAILEHSPKDARVLSRLKDGVKGAKVYQWCRLDENVVLATIMALDRYRKERGFK